MISTCLRVSRFRIWLPRLVILLAASANSATSVAYERITVNLFRGPIIRRDFTEGELQRLVADPAGSLYLLRDNFEKSEIDDKFTIYKNDDLFTFNVNGVQIGVPIIFEDYDLESMAVDSAGNLYVGGFTRIIKFTVNGPPIFSPTPANDLAVDGPGNVYALETDTLDDPKVVRKLSPQLQPVGQFNLPVHPEAFRGVDFTVDAAGNIYANYRYTVVRKLSSDGQPGPELDIDSGEITYNPEKDEILGIYSFSLPREIRRFDTNGQFLGNIPLPPISVFDDFHSISADAYGSIYLTTSTQVYGFDPTITTDSLVAAASEVALSGLPLEGSPQGEYLKGLAWRAGRTRNNLRSLSEARQRLTQLRAFARGTDVDGEGPLVANLISGGTERINGFLKLVEDNSPLIVGDEFIGLNIPSPKPTNPFAAFIQGIFAEDPFYGRYHASQPISSPPPAHVELTLDSATATTSFIRPRIWGGVDLVEPQVITSRVVLDFNGLVPTVSDFTMVLGSIDINGTPSGLNRGRLSPSGQLHSQIGRQGRDFTAHVEGWITNDLYTESRPIFSFLDLEGYVARGTEVGVYGTNEPLIVPGLPGGPPTTLAGIGFAATRAEFNFTTNTLQFRENTDPAKPPDLSVILTPGGVFAHGVGSGEPAVGAGISLTPLVFTGLDATSGRYEFADAVLTIMAESGPFGTALLTDIGIDPESLIFTGELDFNLPLLRTDSPFVNTLHAGPANILLLPPSGTLELLTRTANFTRNGMTQTDFIVLGVVPEPSGMTLCAVGLFAAAAGRWAACYSTCLVARERKNQVI